MSNFRIPAFLLGLLFAAPLAAEPLLYKVSDEDSTVWLLGSVHALRAEDYPLDERIESAYDDADRLVLEVDPDELKPERLAAVLLPMAHISDGSELSDYFSKEEHTRIKDSMRGLGLNIEQFSRFKPWFVALQVFSYNLARHGFAAAEGVDTHYAERAERDDKPTTGLETARQQFALFDSLPVKTQKAFLLDTLEESNEFQAEMEKLVALWRSGDSAALEGMIEEEFAGEPELREAMLTRRNAAWVKEIDGFLDAPDDTLIIVGALHLVGEDGLVALLQAAGHDVRKVE